MTIVETAIYPRLFQDWIEKAISLVFPIKLRRDSSRLYNMLSLKNSSVASILRNMLNLVNIPLCSITPSIGWKIAV